MSGYPEVLKYYMWSWQVHFRISCQTAAESLFNQLDRGLRPNVFLIGFLKENRKERLPICIEPEEYNYSIEEFKNIQSVADNLYANDEQHKMIYTGPGVQEEMDSRLKTESFRLAIEKILNESVNNPGNICFVSSPAMIDSFQVFLVLELNQSIYESHVHLKKVDLEERMKVYFSLLESTKDSFLKDRLLNMYLPEPGRNLSSDSRSSEELLREAGKSFMYTIAWAGKYGMGYTAYLNLVINCQHLNMKEPKTSVN